ncbi:helix-turn-helix transcriptional regulator [Nocardioides donggukensis]|uniref:WYL domain-containing protein n=1 Tax=Nocardioides donggukensis TaxID=2774019 RepID=A0A927K8D1_9ACTN|nr:WYL domain-containing protein [Nocardioides donggukensis]MBD8869530.1 WYL domain-containing protein [Nocardioides donggukensis]
MSAGAKEQVGRLLALVPLIQRRGPMRVADAARELDVDPGQLVKDLRVLVYCGWPGWLPGDLIEVDLDALDGEQVIRITNADYLRAPLRLSPAEASAIIVALRTLRASAEPATLDSLDRALAKLEAAAEDGRAAAHVDVLVPDEARELAGIRSRLDQAVREGRQVRLTYHVPARDENTDRVVDPMSLVDAHGKGYLQGWCHAAEARRLFRLDRIVEAEVLGAAATEHPEEVPVDLSEGLFRPSPDMPVVTLALAPEARWVAEYYPVQDSRETGDGGLEVDLVVADRRWLLRLLLRLAPHAEVREGGELAGEFHDAARAALGLYDDPA